MSLGKPPVAIDQPFRFGVDGSVATTRNVDRQILQRLTTIIATNPTERIMMPTFGVGVARMVFEPDPESVVADLSTSVSEQAALYEPGALITKLSPHPEASKGMALLDVGFRRTDTPDAGVSSARFVHYAVIGPGGVVSEVIRG